MSKKQRKEAVIGDLLIKQRSIKPNTSLNRDYDLKILAVSWEERCLNASKLIAKANGQLIAIKFQSTSPETEKKKKKALAKLRKMKKTNDLWKLSKSVDVSENFDILREKIQTAFKAKGSPLKILIDITCIPKAYSLFIIGMGFTQDMVSCLDCLYSPGLYDLEAEPKLKSTDVGGPRPLLSNGKWTSQQIPYLTADDYIPKERDLVVSMGGELGLSRPFIERVEPNRMHLIFISETAPDKIASMAKSEKAAYDQMLNEPQVSQNDFLLCDVIQVANDTIEFTQKSISRGVIGMAIGSKSHAIALAIAAISEQKLEIVCRSPVSYHPVDVPCRGDIEFIELSDRFEPASYF